MIRSMAVIGTGLIGTSVALAASRRGLTVYLADRDESAAAAAAARGAGRAEPPPGPVDLAVLAVPPSQVGPVLAEQQKRGLARSYTDVASVKSEPENQVLASAPEPSAFVGGHPLAGGERSGPLAASADLFTGRAWVLTPSPLTSQRALDRGRELVEVCGGVPLVMPSRVHDEVVALTSHLPHVVASLLAARLLDGPEETPLLAGRGLDDVTRIAGGSSLLWSDILRANAAPVARILGDLQADITGLLAALNDLALPGDRSGAQSMRTVMDLLDRGIAGRARIRGGADGPRGPRAAVPRAAGHPKARESAHDAADGVRREPHQQEVMP
ncbi:prephenate dehydrogenase [Actinomadura keratinilytica]|uniref:Prephenate/arogenate dehydrogenase domain-containing protein n=1 Tax=Actinomadura keratinilytica TaxID=547461 RepID=A0ABP7YRZ9_9ACTN